MVIAGVHAWAQERVAQGREDPDHAHPMKFTGRGQVQETRVSSLQCRYMGKTRVLIH